MKKAVLVVLALACLPAQGAGKVDLRKAARKFVEEVEAEIRRAGPVAQRYRTEGISPAVPEQSRRFIALSERSKIFGLGIYGDPFGWCGTLGMTAESYWTDMWGARDPRILKMSRERYEDSLKGCKGQVKG